jgi:SsrA-binding protein
MQLDIYNSDMSKDLASNKKAFFEYELLDRFEAGIVLTGVEIKAIRAGKINLAGSHAKILESSIKNTKKILNTKYKILASHPELYIINMHIGIKEGDQTKTRKLLMHRNEIDKLIGKIQTKGLTLIPTRLYLKKGRAKIELALARGKKLHDKRETIKKRDLERSRKNNDFY